MQPALAEVVQYSTVPASTATTGARFVAEQVVALVRAAAPRVAEVVV